MASAKQGYPVVSRMLAKQAFVRRRYVDAAARRRARRACTRSTASPRPSSRWWWGPRWRAPSPDNSTGCRTTRRWRRQRRLAKEGSRSPAPRSIASALHRVLEMGGSSDLCAQLSAGEPVVLMGPTGHPTETPSDETVLLIGGGLGNAVLFSIGQALRANGSRVIYFAGYKRDRPLQGRGDRARGRRHHRCCDAAGLPPRPAAGPRLRRQHRGARRLWIARSATRRSCSARSTAIAIGSDGMMAAVARPAVPGAASQARPKAIASINSPMQCR